MANIDAIKILGSLLNSGALSRGSGSNVLGSVIGALAGGQSAGAPSSGGGLGSLIGGMLGGGQQPGGGGGMGDLLGGLLGGGSQSSGGGLGDLFGMAMNQFGANWLNRWMCRDSSVGFPGAWSGRSMRCN
jgi:hypothetical protein